MSEALQPFDAEVRLEVYRAFLRTGRAPAEAWQDDVQVRAALRRLAARHALVLDDAGRVRMAMPFSNVPTPISVTWGRGAWWPNCAWDALGIPVLLGSDADVETFCPDCDRPLHLSIRGENVDGDAAVVHFPLPASRWWSDIVDT